ncbi:MAG: hypothetical protein GY797_05215 [Deltaproteobacteria bacterium]|nr:hypothetical protein [Deltaproteobacteria bacterium]
MKKSELWEVRVGILSASIAAASIIVSVLIYLHGLGATIEKEQYLIDIRTQREYERQLWDERRASYSHLASTLGEIAAEIEVDKNVTRDSLKAFSKAYWGALILIEDEAVRDEMVKLKNDLRDLTKNRISSDKIKLRIQKIVSLSKAHIAENFTNENVN